MIKLNIQRKSMSYTNTNQTKNPYSELYKLNIEPRNYN